MDYGIRKNFGLALLVKFRIHQSIIQNMYFTFKNPSFKKTFWIYQTVIEICIPDLEIRNSKKSILEPTIRNRIRLMDSVIWKSIIYAKIASRTPPHPGKKKYSVPE